MEWIQIPNGALAQVAQYSSQIVSQYKGNPLIEALPPIMSKEAVVQALSSYPHFDEEERYADSHYRFHMIQQLLGYFQVMPLHIDLENRISRLIRQGYVNRNLLKPHYASQMVQGHADIQSGQIRQAVQAFSSGMTIVGISGIGKSTAINRILSMMPQVISHSDYNGAQLSAYQVLYLRLECPPDGSIRGLFNNFFVELDQLLGTNYMDRFGKNSKLSSASLMPIVTQIAKSCSLGLLCVDEIQNLSVAKSGGAEKMLSFFVTLSNSIGLPTILIGTPRAHALFSDFRIARRGSCQGDVAWLPMKKEEPSWRLFIEGIWDYQWVRTSAELTTELNDAIYEACCGITDIAVKIFMFSQIRAITSGTETITPQIIKGVVKDSLKLVEPMLCALRSGDVVQIAKYGDINITPIDGFIEAEQSKLELGKMLRTFQQSQKEQKVNAERLKQDAIVRLTLLGISEKEAKQSVSKILLDMPHIQNIQELVQEAYKLHLGLIEDKQATSKKQPQIIDDERDLRKLVKAGKENGFTAYQVLKDAGYIASDFSIDFGSDIG
ncbi:ATP-binding protein [Paenibacillus polymyxa]|uniref:ATP-binding protein n=1 Tax=Paenibacillus polymyxa TaxID=1406 RepID=UPI002377F380|nr:ATP-binding protein [Paenibacillus polymyxa]WDM21265.1 ATP-binding protein [Paenibacillus polymyxa]